MFNYGYKFRAALTTTNFTDILPGQLWKQCRTKFAVGLTRVAIRKIAGFRKAVYRASTVQTFPKLVTNTATFLGQPVHPTCGHVGLFERERVSGAVGEQTVFEP
jgi:hypothetical protein